MQWLNRSAALKFPPLEEGEVRISYSPPPSYLKKPLTENSIFQKSLIKKCFILSAQLWHSLHIIDLKRDEFVALLFSCTAFVVFSVRKVIFRPVQPCWSGKRTSPYKSVEVNVQLCLAKDGLKEVPPQRSRRNCIPELPQSRPQVTLAQVQDNTGIMGAVITELLKGWFYVVLRSPHFHKI